jgi:hypothetical protein
MEVINQMGLNLQYDQLKDINLYINNYLFVKFVISIIVITSILINFRIK